MKIPERYLQKINPLMAHARELVESGETLQPFVFVGNLTHNVVVPFLVSNDSDDEIQECAQSISFAAKALEADFIFQIAEAWMLQKKYADCYNEIIEMYGSINDSPYAQEVVVFSLETTHGTWMSVLEIKTKPKSKKPRTFGSVVFEHTQQVTGAFLGLLERKENANGSLH